MPSQVLISIIIPCYNAEKYILDCLRSVLGQTFTDWECIVINDGSTDASPRIIEEFVGEDPKFRFISQENQGLSSTRNIGIDESTGKYLFFLDADDSLPQDSLQNLISSAKGDEDIITGITATVVGTEKKITSTLLHPKEGNITFENTPTQNPVLIRTMESGLSPVAPNRLYKKDFLLRNQLRFTPDLLHEDELWFFQSMFCAGKYSFIDKITYHYQVQNPDSITKNISDKNLFAYLKILKTLFSYTENTHLSPYQRAVSVRYLSYFKKLIIETLLREFSQFSEATIQDFQHTMKQTYIHHWEGSILSKSNESYYQLLNTLSIKPIEQIRKYYFRNPINSIRKRFLLFYLKNTL